MVLDNKRLRRCRVMVLELRYFRRRPLGLQNLARISSRKGVGDQQVQARLRKVQLPATIKAFVSEEITSKMLKKLIHNMLMCSITLINL